MATSGGKRLHLLLNKNINKKNGCKIFAAPFDVYLFGDEPERNTVVEPDISIIYDRTKIKEKAV